MRTLTRAFTLFVAAAIFVAVLMTARKVAVHVRASSDIQVSPFTLVQETKSYQNAPAGEVVERRTVARQRDGSTGTQFLYVSPTGHSALRRVDLADGRVFMLADTLQLKSSGRLPESRLAAWKAGLASPAVNCIAPGDSFAGEERLLGQHAIIVIRSDERHRFTNWRAPSLQCYELQTRVEEMRDGGWQLLAFKELKMLTPGDPAAMWFDPGTGYDEVAPSGIFGKLAESSGKKWNDCPECPNSSKLEEVDRSYYQMR